MKKSYKKIFAAVIFSAALCLSACSGQTSDVTGTTASETEEESYLTTALETSVTTEAKTETEASETIETTKSTEVLTVSPSGYILDPNVTLGEYEYAYLFPEKQPCLIGEPVEGVMVYGMNGGKELSYTYDQPAWGEDEYDQYIIIEHDGIADEFAGLWAERFGTAMSLYPADLDGDGQTEIATVRYGVGGTLCHVMELVIYKLNEGHYERFLFNTRDFNKENITVDIDNEKRTLAFSINGFDKSFAYDFSESVPTDTECSVNMIQVNDFILDGGEITYIVTPLIGNGNGLPETPVDICFKLNFSDGEFTCSGVKFNEEQF